MERNKRRGVLACSLLGMLLSAGSLSAAALSAKPAMGLAEDEDTVSAPTASGIKIVGVANEKTTSIAGASKSNVYFGKYLQSSDGNGGFNEDPIKWRVLSNADGKLFLLADQTLDRQWWNEGLGTWRSNFVKNAFNSSEKPIIDNQNAFFLSVAEAMNENYLPGGNNGRKTTATDYTKSISGNGDTSEWWLRDTATTRWPYVVSSGGECYSTNPTYDLGVRPAIKINLSSALFVSAATNGKSATASSEMAAISENASSDYKLTLKDSTRNFAVTEASVDLDSDITGKDGTKITLDYSNAKYGSNEYVSAILEDKDGNATHYGKLKAISDATAASGTVDITIPSGLVTGTYTLHLFNEQDNGDKLTDSASAFDDVILNVTSKGEAAVGKTVYATIKEAFDAASSNETADTIKIIKKFGGVTTFINDLELKSGDKLETYDGFTYVSTTDASITANAQGGQIVLCVTIGANGTLTVDDGTVEGSGNFTYAAGEAETTFTIIEGGSKSLIKGAVKLDKNQEIEVAGDKNVKNTGEGIVTVKVGDPKEGYYSFTVPLNGKVTIAGTEYSDFADKGGKLVMDSEGVVKYCYDMSEVSFSDEAFVYDGEAHSLAISGTLPAGVTVTYENNGKTEPGVYTVTAKFVGDEDQYAPIADMTATLTIKQTSVEPVVEGGDENEVLIYSENGLEPGTSVVVKKETEAPAAIKESVKRDELIAAVYDISLDNEGVSVQPNGNLTIQLRVPEVAADRSFRILHLHGEEVLELSHEVVDGYAVVTVNKLSEFAIVVDNSASILWLIIILAIIVVLGATFLTLDLLHQKGIIGFDILAETKALGNKTLNGIKTLKGKGKKQLCVVGLLPLAGVLPIGEIVWLIILIVAVLALGGYVGYAYFYLPRKKKGANHSSDAKEADEAEKPSDSGK